MNESRTAGIERFSAKTDAVPLLQGLMDITRTLVVVIDPAGPIRMFNRTAEHLTGYAESEVLGRRVWDFLVPEDEIDAVRGCFSRLTAGDYPNTFRNHWVARDGSLLDIHWTNTLVRDSGGEYLVLATGLDMTDRSVLRERLREKVEHVRQVADNLPTLIAHLDADYRIRFINSACTDWFGRSPKRLGGHAYREVVGERAFALLAPSLERAMAGEEVEFRGRIPDRRGRTRFVRVTCAPSVRGDEQPDGVFVLLHDRSRGHLLQQSLIESTVRYQAILDTATEGIVTIHENGEIESVNRALEGIFGYRADELIGRNVSVLMPPETAAAHDSYIRRYLETGRARIIGTVREVTGCHKNGHEIPLELSIAEINLEDQHLFTGFVRDISRRREAIETARRRQFELAHVNRLAALSDLASGIAHEVNQPLTAMVSTAQACLRLLREDRASTEDLIQALERVALQGRRAGDIIGHLRSLIRREDSEACHPVDFSELLDSALELVRYDLQRRQIRLDLKVEEGLPRLHCRRIEIEQVLLNLIQNAIDALLEVAPERRRLEISAALAPGGDELVIRVADTGAGFADSEVEKLFEAFYTTKKTGLGQGLSISRTIVESHGGRIGASIRDGAGAVFELVLPCGGQPGTNGPDRLE